MKNTDRPWRSFYAPGVRAEIDTPAYRNLPDFIHSVAETFKDSKAFTCCLPNGMNGTATYGQIDEMSDAFAVYLREVAGLSVGDRVAVQMPNCLSFPVVAFGVFKAGCILVNVNPLYTAEEMAKQFEDAEPHALVIVDMFADKIPAATQGHPIPNVIVTRVAEFLPSMPRGIVGLVQKYWDKSVKPIELAHIRLPDTLAAGRTHKARNNIEVRSYHQGVATDDVAVLQYTGGTTGVAKGAMLTHGNLLFNTEQAMELLGSDLEKGKEVILTALPLYHIFAFTVNMMAFFKLGAHNILIPNPRPLSNLKRAFENYKITWMSGVNTLFNGLCNEIWFLDSPPKHMKFAGAGGMALQSSVAERWREITGTEVLQGYGLTETSPVLTFEPPGKAREGTIGIPVPSTDVACFDDAGKQLALGETGEIAARGPQIMKGYWKKTDETANVMIDDWFLTGDIGFMDPDGYFRIVDRKKDMVVVSGFNVYPNEIEDVLAAHPAVIEAAVIGVPDGATGEAVKAYIVTADTALNQAAIRAYCKEHLTGYKVPKRVEFRDELPKSNVGKILRKDLRAEALAQTAAE
ncbi:AMP-binding protein [Tateyamaria armeniaca]|uniref:Long-chain-fatty-acid--CoA ligase n=1 Tax=Tateyamaria armeniaca TaxID=2518930 RepID=A0ABW8UNK6_9RHOB